MGLDLPVGLAGVREEAERGWAAPDNDNVDVDAAVVAVTRGRTLVRLPRGHVTL